MRALDDGDGDVAAVALGEEAGPELGLHEDEEVGLEEVQVAADGGGEVEREVKDVGGGEALASEGPGRWRWWWR